MATFSGLLTKHVAASIDKQQALLKLVGQDAKAKFDLKKGTLSFTDGHIFGAQLLGVESPSSNTWRWAWGEGADQMPEEMLVKARQIRAAAEKAGIAELAAPRLSLEALDGRQIALVSVGITRSDCFFKVQHQGRSLYLLLTAPPVRAVNESSPAHVSTVFFTVIQNFEVGHREALVHYLTYKGYTIHAQEGELHATSPAGEHLKASFTEAGKLVALTTKDADEGEIELEEPAAAAPTVQDDPMALLAEEAAAVNMGAQAGVYAPPPAAPQQPASVQHRGAAAGHAHAGHVGHAGHGAYGHRRGRQRRSRGVGVAVGIAAVFVVMIGALVVGALFATGVIGGGTPDDAPIAAAPIDKPAPPLFDQQTRFASDDGDTVTAQVTQDRWERENPVSLGWVEFTVDDVGLTVYAPSELQAEQSKDGYGADTRTYSLVKDDAEFGVLLTSARKDATSADVLAEWEQSMRVKSAGEKFFVDRGDYINGIAVRRVTYRDGAGRQVETQALHINGFLVQVITSAPPSGEAQQHAKMFQKSLSLDRNVANPYTAEAPEVTVAGVPPQIQQATPRRSVRSAGSLEEVLEHLRSGDDDRVLAMSGQLSRFSSDAPRADVADALIKAMKDGNPYTAKEFAGDLKTWSTLENVDGLLSLFDDVFPTYQAQVLEAMAQFDDPRVTEKLAEALESSQTRAAAKQALEQRGAAAEEPLLKVLEDATSRFTKVIIIDLLAQIGSEKSRAAVERMTRDGDPFVSSAAKQHMEKMQEQAP